MIKKFIALLLLGLFGFSTFLFAGTGEISNTARVLILSVNLSQDSIAFGDLEMGATTTDSIVVSNLGNQSVDIMLSGQDTSDWTLSETQGTEEYVNAYDLGGTDWKNLTTSYGTTTQMLSGATSTLNFLLGVPTLTTATGEQSWTNTLLFVAQ